MKNLKRFFEEVDIEGNPAIPGEGPKRDGERPYLSDSKNRAFNRYGLTDGDVSRMTPMGPRPSRTEMMLGRQIMEKSMTLQGICRGHDDELSQLATSVFYNTYKDIIDKYEIELDIKIATPRQVKQNLDDSEDSEPPNMRAIKDEETIKEIHKRKIANLIIQGEAKNSKLMIHMDEVRDGLVEILGDRNGRTAFTLGTEITSIADKLDWIRIEEILAQMMEEMPEGLAGSCKVSWKPKEEKESDEDEEEENEYNLEDDINGSDDEEEYTEEGDGMIPVLKARGVDFVMLFHEAVKGLFEILSLGGIPEDKEISQKVIANTGLADEGQDLKYGPEIAADLRDFVNKNPKIDSLPNIREEIWKFMVDKNTMPTSDFLEFMRGILSNTPEARRKMDRLIDKVIEDINSYNDEMKKYQSDMEEYRRDKSEYNNFKSSKPKRSDDNDDYVNNLLNSATRKSDDHSKEEPKQDKNDVQEIDYSGMSKKQLDDELNKALDSGDYELAKKISPFIKESISYRRRNFKN